VAEQPLKDIIVVMRDTGMRNARELYCMRVENVDFDGGTIFTPDSKRSPAAGSSHKQRVKQILEARCVGRSEAGCGCHVIKESTLEKDGLPQWVRARQAAGCPRACPLLCAP